MPVGFQLTDSQLGLRNAARAFASGVLSTAPALYAHLPTQRARFEATLPIYRTAFNGGLIRAQIPTSLGGTSESLVDAALVVEELYAVEPSAAITILGTGLGLTPLILAAAQGKGVAKDVLERVLGPFLGDGKDGAGPPIAAFVHSEPKGTANWLEVGGEGLGTTAWLDEERGEWVVNGEKLWTTNSAGWDTRGADLQCVVCRQTSLTIPSPTSDPDPSSRIIVLLITRADVSKNDPSSYQFLSEPDLLGHKSASGPHTKFTNFHVPVAQLLAAPGEGAQLVEQTFGTSAAIVGAMSVGIMRAAFEAALNFAKSDARGGTVKIVERQAVAEKLIDVKVRIEAARLLTWKAMDGLMSGPGEWRTRLEAALVAKVFGSENAVRSVVDAMAVVGVKSYAEDQPFARLLENAAVLPIFDGGNLGVRRRQLEKLFQAHDYEPWAGTYPST